MASVERPQTCHVSHLERVIQSPLAYQERYLSVANALTIANEGTQQEGPISAQAKLEPCRVLKYVSLQNCYCQRSVQFTFFHCWQPVVFPQQKSDCFALVNMSISDGKGIFPFSWQLKLMFSCDQ